MKHLPLFSLVAAVGLLAQVHAVSASEIPSAPHLYRSPDQSAVYYALNDGRRFAFPNQNIYGSWYPSFDAVVVVPASTLAQYRLAGVVLYRPGSLIKVATDPKVYLVSNNGELRWIETEAIAQGLFGNNWATHVQDVSDAFFFSYRIGESIHMISDISLETLRNSDHALSIAGNQELIPVPTSTAPAPTPTVPTIIRDIVLQSSLPHGIRVNESATINVYADHVLPSSIVLTVNGAQVQRCAQAARCTYTFTHRTELSMTSYVVQADATYADGTHKIQSYTIPVVDLLAGSLRQTVDITESQPQGNVDIFAHWDNSVVRPYRVSLFVNGNQVKECYSELDCHFTYGIDAAIGSTLNIHSTAEDTSGQTWQTTTSTVSIVENPKPMVSAGLSSSIIYTGEHADVSVQASDENGIAFIEIWQDGLRVARCERPGCSYTSGTFTESASVQFHIIAQDLRGARQEIDLEPMLVVSAAN